MERKIVPKEIQYQSPKHMSEETIHLFRKQNTVGVLNDYAISLVNAFYIQEISLLLVQGEYYYRNNNNDRLREDFIKIEPIKRIETFSNSGGLYEASKLAIQFTEEWESKGKQVLADFDALFEEELRKKKAEEHADIQPIS